MQVLGGQILQSEVGVFEDVNDSFRQRYVKKPTVVEDISKGQSNLRKQFSKPLMVLMGLSIFALSVGVIGVVWIDHYRDLLAIFGA